MNGFEVTARSLCFMSIFVAHLSRPTSTNLSDLSILLCKEVSVKKQLLWSRKAECIKVVSAKYSIFTNCKKRIQSIFVKIRVRLYMWIIILTQHLKQFFPLNSNFICYLQVFRRKKWIFLILEFVWFVYKRIFWQKLFLEKQFLNYVI